MYKKRSFLFLMLVGLLVALPSRAEDLQVRLTPNVGYVDVEGDESAFREHSWNEEGMQGGLKKLSLSSSLGEDATFQAEGHARIHNDDYGIELELRKEDTGLLRAGYTRYSKYFDDTGGFYEPFAISSFDLDRDLELDIGSAFLEAALIVPEWPEIRLSYEHRFKEGEKSLTGWGGVTQSSVNRNIFPALKTVDNSQDIVTAEVEHTINQVRLHDRFRYERFESETTRFEQELDLDAGTSESVTTDESRSRHSLFNTFHTEMRISDSMYASAGYLYSTQEADADFDMTTVPFNEPFDKSWSASRIDLDRRSHIINLNLMAGPYRHIEVSGGVEGAWSEARGDTEAVLTEIGFGGNPAAPKADISTDKDRRGLEENLSLRYSGLPRTDLYGRGRWTQLDIDLEEREIEDGSLGFARSTDTNRNGASYKLGFHTSPIQRVTLSGHIKRESTVNEYDHDQDTLPDGYSAFINEQDITTNELGARLNLQPRSWIRTSLAYRLVDREIDTTFDNNPSSVRSGSYDAHIYSLDITFTPLSSLFLTTLVTYRDISGTAFDNGVDSVLSYEGDVLSSSLSARYALNQDDVFRLSYTYSRSDNFKDNSGTGLPLLLEDSLQRVQAGFTRKLSEHLEAEVSYRLQDYEGDHNSGINDYTAHLVGVSLSLGF